jgi:hypothetical protein
MSDTMNAAITALNVDCEAVFSQALTEILSLAFWQSAHRREAATHPHSMFRAHSLSSSPAQPVALLISTKGWCTTHKKAAKPCAVGFQLAFVRVLPLSFDRESVNTIHLGCRRPTPCVRVGRYTSHFAYFTATYHTDSGFTLPCKFYRRRTLCDSLIYASTLATESTRTEAKKCRECCMCPERNSGQRCQH